MKIRTDFVTNSSSSSFAVEIIIQSTDGTQYGMKIDEENSHADLTCTATEIMDAPDVEALVKLLQKSLDDVNMMIPEEIDRYKRQLLNMGLTPEEAQEEIDVLPCKQAGNFFNRVQEHITDIDQIEMIKLRRIWEAWGEASSCFGASANDMYRDLPILAQRVCQAKDSTEKERAKAELLRYINEVSWKAASGWQDTFPTGFMGSKVPASLVWQGVTDDIEELAAMIVNEELPNVDLGKETVIINRGKQEITRKAEYYLYAEGDYDRAHFSDWPDGPAQD